MPLLMLLIVLTVMVMLLVPQSWLPIVRLHPLAGPKPPPAGASEPEAAATA